MSDLPEFRMPSCHRHFFRGHRWWCRGCDREAERQFRQMTESWWGAQDILIAQVKLNNVLMTSIVTGEDSPEYDYAPDDSVIDHFENYFKGSG